MAKKPNKHGGGALTNANGLLFEQTTSLDEALRQNGYSVSDTGEVKYNNVLIGYSRAKYKFRKYLKENNVNLEINSDILLPDDTFINTKNKTVYIIEKKFQRGSGSVAEKIQTCEYKKQQYQKLVSQMGYEIEYAYVLCDFFKNPKFSDALKYIKSKKCYYFFNELPLKFLGL